MGVHDPRKASIPRPSEPFPKELGNVHGPLKLARILVTKAWTEHAAGGRFVAESLLSMVLLARHVLSDDAAYETWLSDAMRRAHAVCPANDVPLVQQPALPTQFFHATAADPSSSIEDRWARFFEGLDRSRHPYLLAEPDSRSHGYSGPATVAG